MRREIEPFNQVNIKHLFSLQQVEQSYRKEAFFFLGLHHTISPDQSKRTSGLICSRTEILKKIHVEPPNLVFDPGIAHSKRTTKPISSLRKRSLRPYGMKYRQMFILLSIL